MKREIDKMLREVAIATTGVESFGRGANWADNISDEDKFPRVWIHDIRPNDEINFHVLTTKYIIVGELCSLIDFDQDSDGTIFEETLATLTPIYQRFITNLSKDARNKGIKSIRRVELIHKRDANLAGFAFSFQIEIKEIPAQECL
jgi:hypothetical protein